MGGFNELFKYSVLIVTELFAEISPAEISKAFSLSVVIVAGE